MGILSLFLKRRLLEKLIGGVTRSSRIGRTGALARSPLKKAVLAGITAMLVKRVMRRR
jgi:hypothetical protein